MERQVYISLNHFPIEKADEFKDADERYRKALSNLISVLDGLHINFTYLTATVHIGDYKKEVECGIYLPDLDLILNYPTMGYMGLSTGERSINIAALVSDPISTSIDILKFLNK